ncbi:MAG: hypothetical protein U0Q11_21040 [Vicinamibacterales bacterium]
MSPEAQFHAGVNDANSATTVMPRQRCGSGCSGAGRSNSKALRPQRQRRSRPSRARKMHRLLDLQLDHDPQRRLLMRQLREHQRLRLAIRSGPVRR